MYNLKFFKNNLILIELSIVVLIIWLGTPNFIFDHFKNPNQINDLDNSTDIIAIWGLDNGLVPYLDFQWVYGPLMLLLQYILYKILGNDYAAIFFSKWIIINVFGIIVAYLISCIIFKKNYSRIIFLILSVLFITANMVSLRHLIPEIVLTYSTFLLTTAKNDEKNKITYYVTGLLFGLCLLISVEYGIAAFITYIFIFSFILIYQKNSYKLIKIFYVLTGFLTVITIFLIYLYKNNALSSFYTMYVFMLKNQVLTNPARPEFLPYPFFHSNNQFNLINLFRDITDNNFKFYIPFIIYIISILYLTSKIFKRENFKFNDIFILVFTFYGLGILFRSIAGPAYGFMTYAFIPSIIILTFYIEKNIVNIFIFIKNKSNLISAFVSSSILFSMFIWCIFAQDYYKYKNIYKLNNNAQQLNSNSYNSVLGFKIPEEFNKGIVNISSAILNNSTTSDSVFVYPFGVFGFLAGRSQYAKFNPYFSVIYGPDNYDKLIYDDLLKHPPKLVVLNKLTREVGVGKNIENLETNYIGRFESNSSLFTGEINLVKKFIIENYELIYENKYAAVFKISRFKPFNKNLNNLKNYFDIYSFTLYEKPQVTNKLINIENKSNNIVIKINRKISTGKVIVNYSYNVSYFKLPLYKVKSRIGISTINNQIDWRSDFTDDMFTVKRDKSLIFDIKPNHRCSLDDCIINFNFYTNFPNIKPDNIEIKLIRVLY